MKLNKTIWTRVLILFIAWIIFFPKTAAVEVQFKDYNIYDKPNNISMSFAYGEEGNMYGEQEMKTYYPAINQAKMSVQDFLWNAHKYRLTFKFEPETEVYCISHINIYLSKFKILSVDASNWKHFSSNLEELGAYVENESICIPKRGGQTVLIFGSIRKQALVRIGIVGAFYFLLILFLMYFGAKKRILSTCKKKIEYLCLDESGIKARAMPYILGMICARLIAEFVIKVRMLLNLELYTQDYEWIVATLTFAIIFVSLRGWEKKRYALFGMIFLAILISISHMTDYFTVDEPRALAEQVNLQEDILRHWFMVNARSNYLIMGTIMSIIPEDYFARLWISKEVFLKLAHWFLGFLLIQYIVYFLRSRMFQKETEQRKDLIATIIYFAFFSLPVFNLAMDNYNYDLFTCLFTCVAFLHMWYAYENEEEKYGIWGLIFSGLAVQEKIISIPSVFVISVLYASLKAKNNKVNSWIGRIVGAVSTLIIQCSVSYVSYLWVSDILKGGDSPIYFYRNFKMIFRLILPVVQAVFSDSLPMGITYLLASILYVTGIIVASIVCDLILKWGKQKRGWIHFIEVGVLLMTVTGVMWTYVNNIFIFENGHLNYFLEYLAIFFGAFPTVVIVITMLWLIFDFRKNRLSEIEALILALWGLMMPVLYTIMGEYNSVRYKDLYILLYLICFLIIMIRHSTVELNKKNKIFLSGCILVSLVEVCFANPTGYTMFYPFWNIKIYQEDINKAGWGSSVSLYGKKIINYCKKNEIPINEVTIRYGYNGDWNNNKYGIEMTSLYEMIMTEDTLEENDFYCIENQSINVNTELMSGYEFPLNDVEPVMYIRYRGAIIARIYQGSQFRPYMEDFIYRGDL